MTQILGDTPVVDYPKSRVRYEIGYTSTASRTGENPVEWEYDRFVRRKELSKAIEKAEKLIAQGRADRRNLVIWMLLLDYPGDTDPGMVGEYTYRGLDLHFMEHDG